MILGERGMTSAPRSRRYELASTVNGPKRYDATIVIRSGESALSIALGEHRQRQRFVLLIVFFERDPRDHIAFENVVDVFRLLNEAEDGVLEIEARSVHEVDKKLRIPCVAATR